MAEVKIETERIDDMPLLVHQQQKIGIPEVLNQVIQPHGNRQGLSVGWLTTAWLSYILSEADHRMSEVEPWADDQIQTLSALLPEPVRAKDCTDDRLGSPEVADRAAGARVEQRAAAATNLRPQG